MYCKIGYISAACGTGEAMSNVTYSGIVLSSMPIGEYDRRLEILTAEAGRISAFARGARRPSSNLVAPSRAFAFGQFELFQGKSSYSLERANITHYFEELTQDVDLTYYGFYFLEVSRYFSRENVPAADELELLYYSLRALSLPQLDNRLIRAIFEIKILDLNGVCPPPERIEEAQGRFAFAAGMQNGTMYAIRFVLNSPVKKLFTFKLSDSVLDEFAAAATELMDMSVDQKFKSLEFLC